MTVILGIDPAISCGWCVANMVENSIVDIIDCGHIEVTKSEFTGDMCLEMQGYVQELFETYNVDEMVIEDYIFSGKKCQGAHLNLYIRGALHMVCRSLGKPYTISSVSNWKSIIAGRSIPTSEMKRFYGKELANKIFIQEALWLRYNIRFPDHSLSQKTKKPIALKYDMVDAVGITIAYIYSKYNMKDITFSKVFPDDVNKASKIKRFKYEM